MRPNNKWNKQNVGPHNACGVLTSDTDNVVTSCRGHTTGAVELDYERRLADFLRRHVQIQSWDYYFLGSRVNPVAIFQSLKKNILTQSRRYLRQERVSKVVQKEK